MANPILWSHDTFAGFMRTSPRRAFEFRLETLGDPIPEEYLTDSEKEIIANGGTLDTVESIVTIPGELGTVENPLPPVDTISETEIVKPETEVITEFVQDGSNGKAPETDPIVETPDEVVEVEITRDELKAKLDEAGVKYFKGTDSQKLADLCVANNLL